MPNDSIMNLLFQINDEMDSGNLDKAMEILNKVKNCKLSTNQLISLYGLMIDLGTMKKDIDLVQEGIDYLENDTSKLTKLPSNYASVFYNLANGYSSLFSLQSSEFPYFSKSKLEKVKKYYRKALNQPIKDKHLKSQILTNLGNCYDNLGRTIEALECYEKSITENPLNGMAYGNKGISLVYYSSFMGEKQGTYLIEAYNNLQDALNKNIHPESAPFFELHIKGIEEILQDIEEFKDKADFPGYVLSANTEIEKLYLEFCMDNRLFLNLCNFCNKCDASIGDTAIIQNMIVDLNQNTSIEENPYFILSGYLNQIKQDYVVSRFLLFISKYKKLNFEFVDKNVWLLDTLSYNLHNIYIELLKTSFKGFYNILDKIACFINYYLHLGMKEKSINFHRIWYSGKKKVVREEIKNTKNKSLNAIFDIHNDFYSDFYIKLREIRNALTHRYLYIKLIEVSSHKNIITEEVFYDYTLELARIIRNAVMYLLHFVFLEEDKKKDKFGGKLIKMKADKIPDHLKY